MWAFTRCSSARRNCGSSPAIHCRRFPRLSELFGSGANFRMGSFDPVKRVRRFHFFTIGLHRGHRHAERGMIGVSIDRAATGPLSDGVVIRVDSMNQFVEGSIQRLGQFQKRLDLVIFPLFELRY